MEDARRILITGMPRSGTSFVHGLFYTSCQKNYLYNKMLYTEHRFFCLSEPACFNIEGMVKDIEIGRKMVDLIQAYQREYLLEEDGRPLFVMKHHFLSSSFAREDTPPEFFDLFDKVLICVRQPESWLLSAQKHESTKTQIQHYADLSGNSPEDYGYFLYNSSIKLLRELSNRDVRTDHVEFLDFHETEENIKKLKRVIRHVSEEEVERVFRQDWRGSTFEK